MRHLTLGCLAAVVCASAIVVAQQQGGLTAADKQRRWDVENELQSIAVVDRKVMMPMPDGVRLATDIYRPKNATGKVPTVWVRTPYNFNFWDVQNGVPADMSAQLAAVKRGYAYVVQNERGHFFSEGNYDILGSRQDGFNTVDWLTKQPWSNGKIGTTGCSSTAEYQMARRVARPSRLRRDERAGIRRRRRPGRAVLRAGQLVPRRRGPDAVHRLAVRRAESGAADVPAEHVARGFDPRVEVVRSRAASPAGGLVEGALAPAGAGHPQGRRRTARHLRRRDAGRDRRQDDSAGAERCGVVPRRPVSRRSEAERARPVVHVVVRRVGRTEPRALQPRAQDGVAGSRERAVGGHRAGRALLLHARHRRHRRRRAQHGRRAPRLQRDRLRVLRSLPERRVQSAARTSCRRSPTSRWA